MNVKEYNYYLRWVTSNYQNGVITKSQYETVLKIINAKYFEQKISNMFSKYFNQQNLINILGS